MAIPPRSITGPNTRWFMRTSGRPSPSTVPPQVSRLPDHPEDRHGPILREDQPGLKAAYEEGQSKLRGNSKFVPDLADLKLPLRDGDKERKGDPAYAGCMFINANSSTAPGIVDADCNPILDRSEVYSGVYGRASINLYAFNSNGNKGIACGCRRSETANPWEAAAAPRTTLPPTTMRTSCPETKKPGGRVMSSAARHERNNDNDHI